MNLTAEEAYQKMPMLLELLASSCRTINVLPLAAMANANERMQTLGPILQPAAYANGGGVNLDDQRRIIDAARNLQRVCEEVAGMGGGA